MPTLVADKRNRCQSIMGRKSPTVSPRASDDKGDTPGAEDPGDGGDVSDDEGDGENVPDKDHENDDAEQH